MGRVDDVLDFLNEWRTSKDVQNNFKLSTIETYHLLRWLRKGQYIECCNGGAINFAREVDKRKYFYKKK